MTDEPQGPSQEEMAAGAEVVAAGQAAAAAEQDPAEKKGAASEAIRGAAAKKGWKLSKDDADMLAGAVVAQLGDMLKELPGQTVEGIREAGGFDKLPDPVIAPATPQPPTGAGSAPAQPTVDPAQVADSNPGGGERTRGLGAFAGWFRGGH